MKISPQRHVAREGHIPSDQFNVQTGDGQPVKPDKAIFPLFKENFDGMMELVGTAFFIHHLGIFVTAKHVFLDAYQQENGGWTQKANLFGLHLFGNDNYMARAVVSATIHNNADLAVGRLQPAKHNVTNEPLTNQVVSLSFTALQVGEKVFTYAYPNTVVQREHDESFTQIHTWPMFYGGEVVKFYPGGRDKAMLPNPCYQTSMTIHGGASGGPVFNSKGKVCALNSTGYPDMLDVSFISRIEEILPLHVEGIRLQDDDEPRAISISEMIEMGQIRLS